MTQLSCEIAVAPTTPPASFLYTFYYLAIFKNPLNVL